MTTLRLPIWCRRLRRCYQDSSSSRIAQNVKLTSQIPLVRRFKSAQHLLVRTRHSLFLNSDSRLHSGVMPLDLPSSRPSHACHLSSIGRRCPMLRSFQWKHGTFGQPFRYESTQRQWNKVCLFIENRAIASLRRARQMKSKRTSDAPLRSSLFLRRLSERPKCSTLFPLSHTPTSKHTHTTRGFRMKQTRRGPCVCFDPPCGGCGMRKARMAQPDGDCLFCA